jgi:hypothetical protein
MDDPIAQFTQWFRRMPPFTKSYITISLMLSLLSTLRIISYHKYYYDY